MSITCILYKYSLYSLSLALSLTLSSAFDKHFLSCFILFLFLTTVVELFFIVFVVRLLLFSALHRVCFSVMASLSLLFIHFMLASFIETTVEQHDIQKCSTVQNINYYRIGACVCVCVCLIKLWEMEKIDASHQSVDKRYICECLIVT